MKERILQIMRKENMTQQDFAKAIEVSPASLSNIFNGKTNPTNNHVSAIHRRFPDIAINWLMFGEGDMYTTVSDKTNEPHNLILEGEYNEQGTNEKVGSKSLPLFGSSIVDNMASQSDLNIVSEDNDEKKQIPIVREVVKYIDKPQRKITEIRIFFDDGTYEVFS